MSLQLAPDIPSVLQVLEALLSAVRSDKVNTMGVDRDDPYAAATPGDLPARPGGSRNALSRDFARIIALIEAGRIDTVPWITHRIPFADTIGAFPQLLEPSSGVLKAVVDLAG